VVLACLWQWCRVVAGGCHLPLELVINFLVGLDGFVSALGGCIGFELVSFGIRAVLGSDCFQIGTFLGFWGFLGGGSKDGDILDWFALLNAGVA
jgi:hypothetical protein